MQRLWNEPEHLPIASQIYEESTKGMITRTCLVVEATFSIQKLEKLLVGLRPEKLHVTDLKVTPD